MTQCFLALLAIQDKREVSHLVSEGKTTVRLVLNDNTKFERVGTDFDALSAGVLADYDAYAAEKERNETLARELQAYAESKSISIKFAVDEMVTYETHPSTSSARAHLSVGDKIFARQFGHCNERKMRAALVEMAHQKLVKAQ